MLADIVTLTKGNINRYFYWCRSCRWLIFWCLVSKSVSSCELCEKSWNCGGWRRPVVAQVLSVHCDFCLLFETVVQPKSIKVSNKLDIFLWLWWIGWMDEAAVVCENQVLAVWSGLCVFAVHRTKICMKKNIYIVFLCTCFVQVI